MCRLYSSLYIISVETFVVIDTIATYCFSRFIVSSPLLEVVNVEGNWIGEGGAREMMLALQERKEAGLTAIKLGVSPRICPEIFSEIMQLTVSSATKKRKSGKGKKKVRKLQFSY